MSRHPPRIYLVALLVKSPYFDTVEAALVNRIVAFVRTRREYAPMPRPMVMQVPPPPPPGPPPPKPPPPPRPAKAPPVVWLVREYSC